MSISDKLLSIANTKSAIKTAIEAKGVTVGSIPFADYPSKIDDITTGTAPEPIPDWVRPADWLAMPTIGSEEEKIVGLYPVFNNDSNSVVFRITGNYTVDWGDGTIENFTASTLASHKYNYASISESTLSSRGYKQVLVTITPQPGSNITIVSMNGAAPDNSNLAGASLQILNWLDIVINTPNANSVSFVGGGNSEIWPMCERVWLKSFSPSGFNYLSMFLGFISLQSVPAFPVTGNCSYMFSGCKSLTKLPGFNFSTVSALRNTFNTCSVLAELPDTFNGSLISGTGLQGTFTNCSLLKDIPPSLAGATPTDISSTFSGCYLIKSIPDLNYSSVTTISNAFSNCISLESFPTTVFPAITGTATSVWSGCRSLQEINVSFLSATSLNGSFFGCITLRKATLTTSASLTDVSNLFSTCDSLAEVNLFNTTSVTAATSMFSGCKTLSSIPAYNLSAATSISGAFNSCNNLTSVGIIGLNGTTTLANSRLSSAALTTIYQNIYGPVTSKTLTVTGNWGASVFFTTASGTTTGSTTITQSNTSGLTVGRLVTGTNISTAMSVTTVGSTDRVDRYRHGLPNGKRVAFVTLTGTSGIAIKTIYYVVNADTDGFQLARTPGGAVIDLVNDGSGTITYPTFITAITTNTNFTVDVPATANGSVVLGVRADDISWATMRGWTVN